MEGVGLPLILSLGMFVGAREDISDDGRLYRNSVGGREGGKLGLRDGVSLGYKIEIGGLLGIDDGCIKEGLSLGFMVWFFEGDREGYVDGPLLGAVDGNCEGRVEGPTEGTSDGRLDRSAVGVAVGNSVGEVDGATLGCDDGDRVGEWVASNNS